MLQLTEQGGIKQWQQIDRHHAYIIYVQENVPKGGKRIMLITASTAINMNQGQKSDIKIRRKKNWKRSERMRGIRL